MINGDIPMLKICFTMRLRSFSVERWKRIYVFLSRKWCSTHTSATDCDNNVAKAAPRIPQSNTKMNIGASTRLHPTESIDESMAFFG